MAGRSRALAGAVLVVAACGDPGAVSLRIDAPAAPGLDPLAEPLASLTLTAVDAAGATVYDATLRDVARGAPLAFGDVPVGEALTLELAGAAASGRVVAYGRAAPLDVAPGAEVEAVLHLRRPFTYLGGAPELLAVDGSRQPGDAYATFAPAGGAVSAAAALPDGAGVVVVAGDAVRVVSTATHEAEGAAAALAGPADDLAVSPDGRWAVASHRADPAGVSIVDLDALRAGAAAPVAFVATGAGGAVAVTDDTAWVVEDPLASLFCEGTSRLRAIALAAPSADAPAIALGGPAGDLAVTPDGAALVVLPCAGQVVRVDGPDATPRPVVEVAGVSAVTVARDRVWVTGHVDGVDAHLTLASMPLEGGPVELLALPTTEERAEAISLSDPTQGGLLRMTADLSSAFAIAVLPDGAHVAILMAAVYVTEPSGDAGGGQPIIPAITMVTYEFQLVQLDTGLAAQRLRTSCTIEWEPGALLDAFACARAPGQDEAPAAFVPTSLTALYGSR